jgi:ABC-type antimicrobial peptide transport system permease subunit
MDGAASDMGMTPVPDLGVLYGVGAVDVISFAAASSLFLTIASVASWLPSRRAMRIDPLAALRDQ